MKHRSLRIRPLIAAATLSIAGESASQNMSMIDFAGGVVAYARVIKPICEARNPANGAAIGSGLAAFEQAYPKYVHWLETYPRYTTARADLAERAAKDPDALIKQMGAESTCEALAESLGQLNGQFARATKDFDFETLPKLSSLIVSALSRSASAAECIVVESAMASSKPTRTEVVLTRTSGNRGQLQTIFAGVAAAPPHCTVEGIDTLIPLSPWVCNGPNPKLMVDVMRQDTDAISRAPPATEGEFNVVLSYAARRGLVDMVRYLLRLHDADPDAPAYQSKLADYLILATTEGWELRRRGIGDPDLWASPWGTDQNFLETIRVLLDAGADPNGGSLKPRALNNLILIRGSEHSLAGIRLLLERGASVEPSSRGAPIDGSPLVLAAAQGNVPALELLLEQRTFEQSVKNDALIKAALSRSDVAARRLVDRGADASISAAKLQLPDGQFIRERISTPDARGWFLSLIAHGANLDGPAPDSETWLMGWVHDSEMAEALLKAGADPNRQNGIGDTALHYAVRKPLSVKRDMDNPAPVESYRPEIEPESRFRAVSLLLRYGANPRIANVQGETPLMNLDRDDLKAMRLLVQHGATITTRNGHDYGAGNMTPDAGPISWALLHRNEALAVELLQRQSETAPEDCGAVYYAALSGATRALLKLIERGAPVHSLETWSRKTPLIAAAEQGNVDIVELLLDRKLADVNEVTQKVQRQSGNQTYVTGGESALMFAAENGRTEVIKLLLRRGASVGERDLYGKTARDRAASKGHGEAYDLLSR